MKVQSVTDVQLGGGREAGSGLGSGNCTCDAYRGIPLMVIGHGRQRDR